MAIVNISKLAGLLFFLFIFLFSCGAESKPPKAAPTNPTDPSPEQKVITTTQAPPAPPEQEVVPLDTTSTVVSPETEATATIDAAHFTLRQASYQERLHRLEADQTFANLKVFRMATIFVQQTPESRENLHQNFAQLTPQIARQLERALPSRQEKLHELMQTVLHSYLDQLLLWYPTDLDSQGEAPLRKSVQLLQATGFDWSAARRAWKVDELIKPEDSNAAKTILAIMK
jgi:hypothetical protein